MLRVQNRLGVALCAAGLAWASVSSPARLFASPVTTYSYDSTYTADAEDPAGQVTTYSYDAVGDRTADSPSSPANPFPGGTTSTTYDAGSNTTAVTDSGSADLSGATRYSYDFQDELPLNAAPGTIDPGTARYQYDTTNEGTIDLPTAGPSVTTYDYDASSTHYLVIEHDTVFDPSTSPSYTDSVTQYDELQLQSDGDVTGRLTNNTTDSAIDLSGAHFILSPTLIPLDQLNATDLPPTDPRFSPIPNIPDGTSLAPGQSVEFNMPEPTGLAFAALAAIAELSLSRRKRTASPAAR